MFRPIIPATGLAGWTFLEATYDRQLQSFAASPQVRNDQAYMDNKLSRPISVDAFLDDRRLLRAALTSFGLGGEEWKRGFIKKILVEAADPSSTFLARLNNAQYTRFAEAFKPEGRTITVSADAREQIAALFATASFATAVGEIDNDLRLGLTYKSEIGGLIRTGATDQSVLFRLLGNVPVRTVLERATNLPPDMRSLPIERQADMLKNALGRRFGIRDLAALKAPAMVDRILERFNALQGVSAGAAAATGAASLALFTGIGSSGSENLFRSRAP